MSKSKVSPWLIALLVGGGFGAVLFIAVAVVAVVFVVYVQRQAPVEDAAVAEVTEVTEGDEIVASEQGVTRSAIAPAADPIAAADNPFEATGFAPPAAPPGFFPPQNANGAANPVAGQPFPPDFGPPGFGPPGFGQPGAAPRGAPANGGFGAQAAPNAPAAPGRANPLSLADLVESVEPSIVRINVTTAQGEQLGSGFLVDDNRTVVTNYHVIEGARRASVEFKFNFRTDVAGVVAHNRGKDLAVLRLSVTHPKLRPLELDVKQPRSGDRAIAIGAPKGFSFTTSQGIVSAVRSGSEISRVMQQSSGVDVYASLGYDTDATWIQTSTAISTGNSGGPLLSEDGKVMAVNTLTHTAGQNLNFAIASRHVRELLNQAGGAPLLALRDLPVSPRSRTTTPVAGAARFGARRVQIELPSGSVFDTNAWTISESQVRAMTDDNAEVAVMNYDTGEVYAVATHNGGTLHGYAVSLYENKEFRHLASYVEGKRHGKFAAWSEIGELLFFAEYYKGIKNGICGIATDNQVTLLLEYDRDTLTWVHVINNWEVLNSYEGRSAIPENDADTLAALDAVDELEERLGEHEGEFRRNFRDYVVDERRSRAAILSVQKRRRMQARVNQRAAARDALSGAVRRAAGY